MLFCSVIDPTVDEGQDGLLVLFGYEVVVSHGDAFYRELVEYHVEDAVAGIVGLDEFLSLHFLGIDIDKGSITLTFCEIEIGRRTVAGAVTVGTGGIEEGLLDGIEHADVEGADIHLHHFRSLRDVDLAEGDDVFPQTVEDAEAYQRDILLDARQFDVNLAVGDIAGGDHLRDAGILIVGILEACDGDAVGTGPAVEAVEYAFELNGLSLRRDDGLRIDTAIVAGGETDKRQSQKGCDDVRTHTEA